MEALICTPTQETKYRESTQETLPTMKMATLQALLFLVLALLTKPELAAAGELVHDIAGNPLQSGNTYRIQVSATGSGLTVAEIGDQTCPLSVVLSIDPKTVIFESLSNATYITTTDSLDVRFAKVDACAASSKWKVYRKQYFPVFIGENGIHMPGTFRIEQEEDAYRLRWCYEGNQCSNLGIQSDAYGNDILGRNTEALKVKFVPVHVDSNYHLTESITYE